MGRTSQSFVHSNYRDIEQVGVWYPLAEFVRSVLKGASDDTLDKFSEQLTELMQQPVCGEVSEESIQAAEEWNAFCDSFFKTYRTVARKEVILGSS